MSCVTIETNTLLQKEGAYEVEELGNGKYHNIGFVTNSLYVRFIMK